MYCIKCKAQLNPGAKFCPYCGTNQQPVSVQTAPVRPQPPRPAAQPAPIPVVPPVPPVAPVPQVAPIQQGTPVPPASNPQANPIRRAAPIFPAQNPQAMPIRQGAPISPVSNPQAAPRTAAPAAQYAQAPVTAPDSVFDFSHMENQCPPDSESEVTSTTMTPPLRDAQRRNTRHISGKGIAGIISGAAVLIAAAVVAAIMILPGVMAKQNLTRAQELLDSERYAEAVVQYDKVISADPGNVEAYNGKADALEEQGLLREAADTLREGYRCTSSHLLSSRCDEIESQLYSE